MCSIEARKKAMEARAILKQVAKYIDNNRDIIIDEILFHLENNIEKSYIDDLEENKKNFKKSIQGHFNWMRDFAETPNKQKVNIDAPKYSIYVNPSLYLAYCDFYEEFSKYIESISKGKAVKDRLQKLHGNSKSNKS